MGIVTLYYSTFGVESQYSLQNREENLCFFGRENRDFHFSNLGLAVGLKHRQTRRGGFHIRPRKAQNNASIVKQMLFLRIFG